MTFEPVFRLAAIEDDFETRKPNCNEQDSEAVDFQLAASTRCFDLASESRRVGDNPAGEDHRNDSDGDVDKENPTPAPVIGDPAAKRRTDYRRRDNRHAIEREGGGALGSRKRVNQDRLLHRREAATSDALQHAEENQEAEARSDSAQKRTDVE